MDRRYEITSRTYVELCAISGELRCSKTKTNGTLAGKRKAETRVSRSAPNSYFQRTR